MVARARGGDARTLEAVAGIGTGLGVGAAVLVALFDPAVVVLGGYFAHLGEFLLDPLRAALAARVEDSDGWCCPPRLHRSRPGRRARRAAAGVHRSHDRPLLEATRMTRNPHPRRPLLLRPVTVGWQGVDVFGGAVREPMDRSRPCTASPSWAPPPSPSTTTTWCPTTAPATRPSSGFKGALTETGMGVEMATTNLFGHAVFKDGAFTANDRDVRRYALAKAARNIDLAAELGATTYVFWGGREGAESRAAKDIGAALERYKEGMDTLCSYVKEQGYDMRFAIEPSQRAPR